jgi:hypothetical protein
MDWVLKYLTRFRKELAAQTWRTNQAQRGNHLPSSTIVSPDSDVQQAEGNGKPYHSLVFTNQLNPAQTGERSQSDSLSELSFVPHSNTFLSQQLPIGQYNTLHTATAVKIPCQHCGKDYSSKRSLCTHINRYHSGNVKVLECPHCNKQFLNFATHVKVCKKLKKSPNGLIFRPCPVIVLYIFWSR